MKSDSNKSSSCRAANSLINSRGCRWLEDRINPSPTEVAEPTLGMIKQAGQRRLVEFVN